MTAAGRLASVALVAWTLFSPATAHAVLDPTRAQIDVDSAIREKDLAFCRAPHEPLSGDEVALCPHAAATPGCEGFAAACDRLPKMPGLTPAAPIALGFLGSLAQALVWALVAVIVLAVLVPVVRALLMARKDKALSEADDVVTPVERKAPEPVEAITDEELLLQRAEQLSREGRHAEALQFYLAASLRALDKRGALRIARDRTNGEYVRACGDASAKPALREIVREVDRAQFGGEPPTQTSTSVVRERAMAIVRAVPAMVLATMVAVAALGCGGGARPSPRSGDRPGGHEVFRELLRKQGVQAVTLDRSLASLEMPKQGERTPAVVVDVERTALDDDAKEHLVRWVKEGGVLVLFGASDEWPADFGTPKPAFAAGKLSVVARKLLALTASGAGDDEEEDDDSPPESPSAPALYAEQLQQAEVVRREALDLDGSKETAAWFEAGPVYAAVLPVGRGHVLGVATDELVTNVGLARPGNAAALVAILSNADRLRMQIAEPEDGISPPTSPLASLLRAGLGPGLLHGLLAILVLFLAVGLRLAHPKPAPPPARRAFAEHVEAVGALYAKTRSAPHALASYARFADDRLRTRMARGATDVPAFLASRAKLPLEACQRLWTRALAAKAGAPPTGDELAVLKELSAVYSAAMSRD